MEKLKTIIFIYIIFIFILILLNLIYNKYLKGKMKYLYLIYWHFILIIFIGTWLYYNTNMENLIYNKKADYILIFIFVILPWPIFYIKNYLLINKFKANINIITYTLLDFIKMYLMMMVVFWLVAIIWYIFRI